MTRRTADAAGRCSRSPALPLTGCSYNTFVSQEEAIKAQWAQVENQLQRRNDLIPNLVETVKGYAHARGERLQGHRRRALAAAGGEVARGDDRGREPADLRARPAARGRRELSAAESERAVQPADGRARRAPRTASPSSACATTSAVQEYNTARAAVPGNLTAKMFGFKEYPFFQAPAEAKQVPKVNFKKPS